MPTVITPITRTNSGECLPLLLKYGDYVANAPSLSRTKLALIPALTNGAFNDSPMSMLLKEIRDEEGKLVDVIFQYDQRGISSDISTTATDGCTAASPNYGREKRVTVDTDVVERVITFKPSEWEAICTESSEVNPNLMNRIRKYLNALAMEIDKKLVQDALAGAGALPTQGLSATEAFNVNILEADGSPDDNGAMDLDSAMAQVEDGGTPILVIDTKSEMRRYVRLAERGALGVGDNGMNKQAIADMLGFVPMEAQALRTYHSYLGGKDLGLIIHPNYLHWGEDFLTPETETVQGNTTMFRFTDPETGLVYDAFKKVIDCGGSTDPRPTVQLLLQKRFRLVTPPLDFFQSGDLQEGFNGVSLVRAGRCPKTTCATDFDVAVTNFDQGTDPLAINTTTTISFNLDPVAAAAGAMITSVTITDFGANAVITADTACTYNSTTGKWEVEATGGWTVVGNKAVVAKCAFHNASGEKTAIAIGTVVVS